MHTTTLRREEFTFSLSGVPAPIETVFEGFDEHDRLGIVLAADGAALGAASLILATVTAFYDRLRAAGQPFFAYPDYYAIHVGRARGELRKLDLFPAHKEIVVDGDADAVLETINDRAITRLLVPEGPARAVELSPETRASALRRIRTALIYGRSGRVDRADLRVGGSERSEAFVAAMVQGTGGDPAAAGRRGEPQGAEPPLESFRQVTVADALAILPGAAK